MSAHRASEILTPLEARAPSAHGPGSLPARLLEQSHHPLGDGFGVAPQGEVRSRPGCQLEISPMTLTELVQQNSELARATPTLWSGLRDVRWVVGRGRARLAGA